MKNYTDQLKRFWKTESLSFIAVFKKFKDKEGFFNDLINPVSLKKLYYPEFENIKIPQKKVSFYVPNAAKYIDGHYYKIDLAYSDSAKRKNNPYSLQVSSDGHLNQQDVEKHISGTLSNELLKKVFQIKSFIDKDIAEEHIKQRFERRTKDPDGNKIIANLMLEIGAGMYSSKQRMIFELLQNADDAPGKKKVEFHIDINGDYFFVMHDGVSFSKEDINAITSAAQSTKKKDKKKTGYKGIGFKSVFTNSTEVWLKSGGYQFAFLRNSSLFKNFDDFYFSSDRYKKYPEFIDEDKLLYAEQRDQFNSSTDIPWQIIPIWEDKLPSEFNDSNFSDFDNPVQFALKVGTNHIYSEDGYLNAIDNIVKRPQFLLFLRNTSKFRSPKNRVTVTRSDNENLIEIEKTIVEYVGNKSVYHQDKFNYVKISYPDIEVSNESFLFHNIDLKKSIKVINQREVYEFVDLNDDLIETIPPKLATVNETEISFGIKIIDNKITAEDGYLNSLYEYSSLFTYLPMEDKRFKLPFLVNADFIPDSRRESLQGDNPWNKYIMIRIAEKHIETIAHYTSEFIKDNTIYNSYLSLLLRKLLPEDDTAQQIIDSYNATYLEQLENIEIIVNDSNRTQLLSNTILDDSGLIELFGNKIFYDIIGTEKKLPHFNLETKYLKEYDYLNVEVVNIELLASQISPEICERLGRIIAQNSLYEKPKLLKWLNKLVKYIPDFFGKIPFILHNNSPFSIELLIEEEDAWLINEHTSQYAKLLEELGYHIIQLNLDKYSNIKEYLHSFSGYINDKTLAYDRVASNSNIHKLPVTSKLKLLDFFQNSDFMRGIGVDKYFGKLKLFIDENDNPRPLRQLLSRKEDLEVNSIDKFRIKEVEYNSIPDALRKELIAKDQIFISFILDEDLFNEWSAQFDSEGINVYVNGLKIIYSWVEKPEDIHPNKWPSIPWLYINDEIRFVATDKVYWSNAFNELSNDKYEVIKSVFHSPRIKTLPVQECGELIKAFPIKTDDSSEIDWSKVDELEMQTANILLDWMEDDVGFGNLFKNYTLVANTNNTYEIVEIEDVKIFDGSDKALKTYIQSNTELSVLFNELDSNLCSENRYKIALLQGEQLVKAIINSGKYDQELAIHLPNNISFELLNSFITNLPNLSLETDKEYDSNSPEHIIVYKLLRTIDETDQVPSEIYNLVKELKNKTHINDQILADFDTSNAISFGRGKIVKGLNLSEVLTEYEGESDKLEEILKSFVSIKNTTNLRKFIFKTRILEPQEIHYKIENEKGVFYSEAQVVFQLFDKSYGNNRNWTKQHFHDYYRGNGSKTQLQNSYKEFLDILFKLDFTELSDFKFHDLTLSNCVDKKFAIEPEFIPDWLEEWVNKERVKRAEFITRLGYNSENSAVVKLREAIISENYDDVLVTSLYEETIGNNQLVWNTIKWLSKYSDSIITKNINLISEINNSIKVDIGFYGATLIPIIRDIKENNSRVYSLIRLSTNSKLNLLHKDNVYSHQIFTETKKQNLHYSFIDNSIGNQIRYYNFEEVKVNKVLDLNELKSNSSKWEEPFYKQWEHRSDYPIYIYEGDNIPYLRSFKNITIDTFTHDLKVADGGNFYVSRSFKSDPLEHLPDSFPEDILNDLKEWERKTLKDSSLLDRENEPFKDISEEDNTFIKNIIKGEFELSEKLDANITAKIKTLILIKNDYDKSEIKDKDWHIEAGDDEIIVRSAQNGLLYLNLYHWNRLKQNHVKLSIYTNNQAHIFSSQKELLEFTKPQNKYGILRMPENYNLEHYDIQENIEKNAKWHYIFIVN
ncbi:sacsin N-terminal ATP-binding-like domain-containing protein, partial [Psychroflexus sp. MES1-P1E]|uniref:sacsin N-terminal ATP-binding-like domain-containing protein n=1 Tax=Psychroflexus sp. MES1-P1E TaxID=2058320 RepID=UPI000C7ADB30